MRGFAIVALLLACACGGSKSKDQDKGDDPGPAPDKGSAAAEPDEPKQPPCVSAGKIDVVGRPQVAMLFSRGDKLVQGEKATVFVSKELAEELGAKAIALLAEVATVVPYEALSPDSASQLRKLGDAELLPLIRKAQEARGDRVMGSFAMIDNYPIILDEDSHVRAILEKGAYTTRQDFIACVKEVVAR